MNVLEVLKEERDRLNRVISILEGGSTGSLLPSTKKRTLSAASRAKIAKAAKTRWAKAKKSGKNRL